jgi:hypothetical protein
MILYNTAKTERKLNSGDASSIFKPVKKQTKVKYVYNYNFTCRYKIFCNYVQIQQ